MTLTVNSDCTQITATPVAPYVTNLTNGVSSVACSYLELQVNCCTPVQLCLRTLYVFDYSVTGCGTEVVDTVTYNYFDVTYTGIDVAGVKEIEYNDFINMTTVIEVSPSDLVVRYHYASKTPLNITLKIRTCDDVCLEYEVQGIIEITDYGVPCGVVIDSGPTSVYPALPTGVVVSGSDLLISPTAFSSSATTFGDGIYSISMVQNNIPDTDSTFVDCTVECNVTDYIASNLCSNLYSLYKALIYADSCSTITVEQKCALWEYIGRELDYFEGSPCDSGAANCGCN